MATGGDVAEAEPETCPVCLEPYCNPKFLPCHHTFCAECISDVANSHTGGPSLSLLPQAHLSACRGVAALQTNFYISTQKATTAPLKRTHCKIHRRKELEFYCVKCDEAICMNCKLTKHEHHKSSDLSCAAEQKKTELATDVARLQDAVDKVQKQVERSKQEQQAVMDKKAAVEKNIHNRHAIMVAAADKFRDEALQSLRSVSADIESDVAKVLKQQEDNLQELMNIQQRLEETVRDGTGSDVIVLLKQMKSGRGSEQAVKKLTSTELSVINRPVLDFKVTSDVMLRKTRDFLGTVCKMEMEDAEPEVRIEKRFTCGTEADVEVFALCHFDDDRRGVWVSYERRGLKWNASNMRFDENGDNRFANGTQGRVARKVLAKDKVIVAKHLEDRFIIYCKTLSKKFFEIHNYSSGKAAVMSTTVLSMLPLKIKYGNVLNINMGAHRAFDVDATEQHFVVVEEPQPPDTWRKVRLYQRPGESLSAPTPSHPRFQPSDVCFYTLRGQHMLLVTDELNDVIHVVRVEGKEMRFVRYLAPGCPLLIQPTAITVDVEHRLWVACRGGDILTITAT